VGGAPSGSAASRQSAWNPTSNGKTVVAYGEALWDLLPGGAVLGGAPLNFACRVGSLGARSVMISRLGRDDLGRRAFEQMQRLGMETGFIQWDDALPTGTVDIEFDEAGSPDYTINPGVAYDAIRLEEGMPGLAAEADCLCFGTLVQRTAASRSTLEALLEAFQGRFRLLDINLRRDCYTEETIRSSLAAADVLKMNGEEAPVLAPLYGMADLGPQPEKLPDIVSGMLQAADLTHCVCTLGARGVLAASGERGARSGGGPAPNAPASPSAPPRTARVVYLPTYYVDVVDPCGSGDAFTAGFIHMLLEGRDVVEACRYGNAMGALVAAQKGATQPLAEEEIRRIMASGRPDEIDARFEKYRV